jgi:hypothetical protein
MHRADLVAEWIAQVGNVDLACRPFAPARRILDAFAAVSDAGVVESRALHPRSCVGRRGDVDARSTAAYCGCRALAVEDRAAFDLICISTAASLLHELRHVRYAQEGDRPEDRCEEERLCDGAARQFLLERASDYAGMAGVPLAKVLSKRTMGLALTAHIIHEGTPPGRRSGFGDPSFECGPV